MLDRCSSKVQRESNLDIRRITLGWTGVDMSTTFLPEGVPEIDADLLSLDGSCGGGR